MERDDHKFPDVLSKETTRRGFLKGAAAVAGGAVALATVGGAASPKKAMAQAPKDVMRYLFAERQNCTGCRACEYACSVYHTGVVRPSVARVHVLKYRGVVDVPIICWHCDDAPCIEACPTTPKAIQKDKVSNGIILDEKICLGAKCLKCKDACPAQFIRVNPDKGMPLTVRPVRRRPPSASRRATPSPETPREPLPHGEQAGFRCESGLPGRDTGRSGRGSLRSPVLPQ